MPLFYRDLRERALAETYHRYYRQLCAVAASVLDGDTALAQDAVQEAWLRLNAPGVRERIDTGDTSRLRGLLLVTVRNAARNLRRGKREQILPEEGWAVFEDPSPGPAELRQSRPRNIPAHTVAAERRDRRQAAPASPGAAPPPPLPAPSVRHISEGAVRQRANRARQRLKKLLQQEGYDDEL